MTIELTSIEAQKLKKILLFIRRNARVCDKAAEYLDLTGYDFLIFLNEIAGRLARAGEEKE